MSTTDSLQQHFTHLGLPKEAQAWLLMLWDVIQFFDDVADADHIERNELDAALWNALVSMPDSQFFQQHRSVLVPLVANAILKWQASDQAERSKEADAKSFVWRAGYYDIVLSVVSLVHGPAKAIAGAREIMSMYGESFEDYLKEFANA
jgi:hypothetical protein